MAVAIKLMRVGKKRQPSYRIVVIDKKRSRNSKYNEKIGYYNPLTNPPTFQIDHDRLDYWQKHGAILSAGVTKIIHHLHQSHQTKSPIKK